MPAPHIKADLWIKMLCFGSLVYILWLPILCFLMRFLCVQTCASLHLYMFLGLFLWFFFLFGCFILFSFVSDLSYCIWLLFPDERQKDCGFRWEERWEATRRRKCNQSTLYGKNLFSIKEKVLKQERGFLVEGGQESGEGLEVSVAWCFSVPILSVLFSFKQLSCPLSFTSECATGSINWFPVLQRTYYSKWNLIYAWLLRCVCEQETAFSQGQCKSWPQVHSW